jgi:hypothetical protein
MTTVASLRSLSAAMTFMALLMECGLEVDNGSRIFILVARGAFFHGSDVMAIDTFGIVLFDMGLVVELYLRQTMPRFFQGDDIADFLIFRFNADMAFLAFYRAALFFVAVFAEIVHDDHL